MREREREREIERFTTVESVESVFDLTESDLCLQRTNHLISNCLPLS